MKRLISLILLASICTAQTTHTTASQEGNNAFTGNNTHAGTETFSGPVSVQGTLGVTSINGIVFVATPCTDVTIQAAITAVGTAGGIVQLPKGTCLLANTVVVGGATAQNSVIFRGHSASAQSFGVGSTGTGTILKWTGAANGTVFQVKSVSNSTFEDFTVDCNTTGGIGVDFTAVNAVQPSVGDHFNRIIPVNCLGTPGQAWHIGSSTNQEAANSYFTRIGANNSNDSWFQEGSQTLDIYIDGFNNNLCVNNGINLRAGSLSLEKYQGGGGTCTTQIRLSNTFSWFYYTKGEIETANASPFLAETSNPVGTNRLVVVRDSTFLWSGAAAAKCGLDILQGMTLVLSGLKFSQPANACIGVSLVPANGLIQLSEEGTIFPVSPAVTRTPTLGNPGIVGRANSTLGDTANVMDIWLQGNNAVGDGITFNTGSGQANILKVKNGSATGWQIFANGGNDELFNLFFNGGANGWQIGTNVPYIRGTESTGAGAAAAGADGIWPDSTAHRLKMNNNNGGAQAVAGFLDNLGVFASGGTITPALYASLTNCSSTGGTCVAAPAGSVSIAAAATTVTVSTTAVTANSQILLTRDDSLGTKLSVTCNTQSSLVLGTPRVTARTAATSFVITIDVGPTTNPMCISYSIVN